MISTGEVSTVPGALHNGILPLSGSPLNTNPAYTDTFGPGGRKKGLKGFHLVGDGVKNEDCLKWKPYATAQKGSRSEVRGRYFGTGSNHIVIGPHYCQRRECPSCYTQGWVKRTASRSSKELIDEFAYRVRIGEFRKEFEEVQEDGMIKNIRRRLKWYKGMVSVPVDHYPTNEEDFKKLRTFVNMLIKNHGFISFHTVHHPFRGAHEEDDYEDPEEDPEIKGYNFRNMDIGNLSVHFHFIGFGYFILPGGLEEDGNFIFKITSGYRMKDGSWKPGALGTVERSYTITEGGEVSLDSETIKKGKRKNYDLKGLTERIGLLWKRILKGFIYDLDHGGYYEKGDYVSQVITGCGPHRDIDIYSPGRPDPVRYYEVNKGDDGEGEDWDPLKDEIYGDCFPQISNFKTEFLNNPHVRELFEVKDQQKHYDRFTRLVEGHCPGEGDPDHDPLTCRKCIFRNNKTLEKLGVYRPEDQGLVFWKPENPPQDGTRLGFDYTAQPGALEPLHKPETVWLWMHNEKDGGLSYFRDDEDGEKWDAILIVDCYPELKEEYFNPPSTDHLILNSRGKRS